MALAATSTVVSVSSNCVSAIQNDIVQPSVVMGCGTLANHSAVTIWTHTNAQSTKLLEDMHLSGI